MAASTDEIRLEIVNYKRKTDAPRIHRVSLVRTYLLERGIMISWFYKETGINQMQFSKIERQKRHPPGTFRAAASLALGEPEKNLFVEVTLANPDDLVVERDPVDDRRVVSVGYRERAANGHEKIVTIWKLADAPWRSR